MDNGLFSELYLTTASKVNTYTHTLTSHFSSYAAKTKPQYCITHYSNCTVGHCNDSEVTEQESAPDDPVLLETEEPFPPAEQRQRSRPWVSNLNELWATAGSVVSLEGHLVFK